MNPRQVHVKGITAEEAGRAAEAGARKIRDAMQRFADALRDVKPPAPPTFPM